MATPDLPASVLRDMAHEADKRAGRSLGYWRNYWDKQAVWLREQARLKETR